MKKILITVLQIAVTTFALYFVFKDPHKRADMGHAFSQADWRWVLAAVAAASLSPIAATVRWGLLLRVQGLTLPWMRVTQLFMVGTFFNLFLFGSTGGDAVKMFYLLREPVTREKRGIAVFSVIMDRLVGLLALIMIAAVFVAMRYRWLTQTPQSTALLTGFLMIMGGAVAGLVVSLIVFGFKLTDKLPTKLPGHAKIIELAAACQMYASARGAMLAGIAVSMVGHAALFLTYYFAARSVHANVTLLDMSVILPIVNTIVSLPISVAGMGLRENFFKDLLGGLCGVPEKLSVPISLIGFFCSVIFYGVVGGLFYLFYRSESGAPPAPGMVAADHMQDNIAHRVEKQVMEHGVPPTGL